MQQSKSNFSVVPKHETDTSFPNDNIDDGNVNAMQALPQNRISPAGGHILKHQNLDDAVSQSFYSLQELQKKPSVCKADALETYLSAADFQKYFGMDIQSFNQLPKWKRTNKKKDLKIFWQNLKLYPLNLLHLYNISYNHWFHVDI